MVLLCKSQPSGDCPYPITALIPHLCNPFTVLLAFRRSNRWGRNTLNNFLEDCLPTTEMLQDWVTMVPAVKELERTLLAGRQAATWGTPNSQMAF